MSRNDSSDRDRKLESLIGLLGSLRLDGVRRLFGSRSRRELSLPERHGPLEWMNEEEIDQIEDVDVSMGWGEAVQRARAQRLKADVAAPVNVSSHVPSRPSQSVSSSVVGEPVVPPAISMGGRGDLCPEGCMRIISVGDGSTDPPAWVMAAMKSGVRVLLLRFSFDPAVGRQPASGDIQRVVAVAKGLAPGEMIHIQDEDGLSTAPALALVVLCASLAGNTTSDDDAAAMLVGSTQGIAPDMRLLQVFDQLSGRQLYRAVSIALRL